MAGEGGAEHRRDADRVLVDVGLDVLGADRVLVLLEGHDPRLDVEVAAELLPHDVHVAAEHEVRAVGGLARGLAALAPLPLERQRAQHDRLGGALRARAGGLAGGVEEVGQHPDAALLDLGRARVLGVVDEVAVQALGDHPLGLGLHPGGHERGEVALRVAVEDQLLRRSAASRPRPACPARAAGRRERPRRRTCCRTGSRVLGEPVRRSWARPSRKRSRLAPTGASSDPGDLTLGIVDQGVAGIGTAGRSNSWSTPPTAKQSAPPNVPQLARASFTSLEVSGSMNAASAEIRNR